MAGPIDGTAGVHGHRHADESLLDDEKAMLANDPGGMLRATASAGAQVRESAALAAEADLQPAWPTRAARGRSWSPASARPA